MEGYDKFLYADDTIILTSTKQAAEMFLHKIQEESSRYNMKLNQCKCNLLGMNSLGSVQYFGWGIHADGRRGTVSRNEYVSKGEPSF